MELPQHQTQEQRQSLLDRHRFWALGLTFAAYAAFHASRKPLSIVKSVLASSWTPFSDPSAGPHRLGELDVAFLFSYSLSMFISGHLADRFPVSSLLLYASLLSAITTLAFALGFFLDIHALSFYLSIQILAGFFQSFGWPCVVSVVTKWHGDSDKKGLIMGCWNSHTSAGNILGSIIGSAVLEFGWGWSFVVPGLIMIVVAVVVYAFLFGSPRDAGIVIKERKSSELRKSREESVNVVEGREDEITSGGSGGGESVDGVVDGMEDVGLLDENGCRQEDEERAIGFLEAWRLPRVVPFAFCLLFSKLVAYTFLYWLPFYIRHTRKFSYPHFYHG